MKSEDLLAAPLVGEVLLHIFPVRGLRNSTRCPGGLMHVYALKAGKAPWVWVRIHARFHADDRSCRRWLVKRTYDQASKGIDLIVVPAERGTKVTIQTLKAEQTGAVIKVVPVYTEAKHPTENTNWKSRLRVHLNQTRS